VLFSAVGHNIFSSKSTAKVQKCSFKKQFKGTVSRAGGRNGAIEQWFKPKLRFANNFFHLKIGHFKAF
jgi:hypothetical protein